MECMVCDQVPPPDWLADAYRDSPDAAMYAKPHADGGGAEMQLITDTSEPRTAGHLCAGHYADMRREVQTFPGRPN